MKPASLALQGRERPLGELALPLDLEELVPGRGDWEVELGFGKGRYLLRRAAQEPAARFLGIEVASRYYRLARDRAWKRGLENLMLLRGEALYLLAAALPRGFAAAVHTYFPDPWPKSRHQRRRFLDAESIDLVLGLLRPGGRLWFATDFLEFGEEVQRLLDSHPAIEVRPLGGGWREGTRTNYEAKYEAEGRPILRLEAVLSREAPTDLLHPLGAAGVLSAHPRS